MKSFKDEMTTGWVKEEDGTQNSMEIFYLELYKKYKAHNEKVLKALEGKEP